MKYKILSFITSFKLIKKFRFSFHLFIFFFATCYCFQVDLYHFLVCLLVYGRYDFRRITKLLVNYFMNRYERFTGFPRQNYFYQFNEKILIFLKTINQNSMNK